jgi:LPS O-antigen subunit length determinant protein (WzzB/FepE family)
MKMNVLVAASLAVFSFTACSENNQGATTAETAAQVGQEGEQPATPTQVVVQTPDYTAVSDPVKKQVSQVLDGYLQVKEALVSSDATAAQEKAQSVLASAQQVNVTLLEGEQKQYAEEKLGQIKESVSKIAESADIESQRTSLEPLSEAVFSLTKAFGASDQTLYYQHCPMANNNAGAYWVSTDAKIRNPYFGERMLTCGSSEEVLN